MAKAKPNKLQNALSQQAQGPGVPPANANRQDPTEARRETTRAGKVMVSGWLPLEARGSLRLILAHHPDRLMQDLVEEAFNDLFAKYDVPQTARLTTAKAS